MDEVLQNHTINELREKIDTKPHKPYSVDGLPVFLNMENELLPDEIFKEHPNLPVMVSNYGRVSFDDKILLQRPDVDKSYPYGYLWVEIPNKSKYQLVYRLVAETWCERPDIKLYNTVHHISNNGMDNRPSNLLWVTKEQHTKIHNFGN
jgi:hypothetical protein